MKIPTIVPVLNRENRSNLRRKYPIHIRVTLNRSSKYICVTLPEKVAKEEWSGVEGRWVKDNHIYAFEINNKIRKAKSKIEDLVKRFYVFDKQISFNDIFQHLKKKGDDRLFNDYAKEYIRLKPDKLAIATWEKYITF
jgi:hypothetical protein